MPRTLPKPELIKRRRIWLSASVAKPKTKHRLLKTKVLRTPRFNIINASDYLHPVACTRLTATSFHYLHSFARPCLPDPPCLHPPACTPLPAPHCLHPPYLQPSSLHPIWHRCEFSFVLCPPSSYKSHPLREPLHNGEGKKGTRLPRAPSPA